MRLEDRFERELNEANIRQANQMTKLKEQFDEEMDVALGKINQLTQELSDAQGTIVAMKREMNQMNNDLMLLLLRQSTFDDKRPAASSATSNNKSIEPASGGDYKASYL